MSAVDLTCLVDDDDIFVYAMKKLISIKQLSKEVISFSTVGEALQYLKSHQQDTEKLPDVLFLDVNLPEHDGWDFVNEFQHIAPQLAKKPRIFMLSSSVDNGDQLKANSHPEVTGFFEKPLSQENFNQAFGH